MGDHYSETPASADEQALVAKWLGRTPRGLQGVAARDETGRPAVIRVASVVDAAPFPTTFWLVSPDLRLAIDRLEAAAVIDEFQARVYAGKNDREALAADHLAHAALRESLLLPAERLVLEQHGYLEGLLARGIGGVANFSRIKCLHAFYAAHLVQANMVGDWIAQRLLQNACTATCKSDAP
ncbi:MAG: DUF501 domain-containing protein [Gammaproteobacteria bacterium]|nr:DUF501 domain-containing protein [Gammaproteobacteria bacterium]NND38722.1 DUF501 domain-containing protein [Pseudomonadales bacterium]MBT8152188.1 DUF501 domain-containing protein [Gammaproteobacteria bacterium]NNL10774.1 DUF501 domain-containing protein [Pseudomonadales bacterium]NNM12186.1 DUF501 domain-containing protein [Pseudomonadales bacterium]